MLGVGGVTRSHFVIKELGDQERISLNELRTIDDDVRSYLQNDNPTNVEAKLTVVKEAAPETKPLSERAASREQYQRLREQLNIEQITAVAAQILNDEDSVSEEALDLNWIARFFDIAKNIADIDTQFLWGQILAGEVKKPQSFSLRTLEFVKNLSRDEVDAFKTIAHFAIREQHRNRSFVLYMDIAARYAFYFPLLSELGLVDGDDYLTLILRDAKQYFTYGDALISVQNRGDELPLNLPVKRFTKMGEELLHLFQKLDYSNDYTKMFIGFLKQDESVVVKLEKIID